MQNFEPIFKSFQINSLELPNRIVMALMTRSKSKSHIPGPTHVSQERWDYLIRGLECGEFDLIAVGRAILADPYWSEKIKAKRFNEIEAFSQEALQRLF